MSTAVGTVISRSLGRFDSWVSSGPFVARDLSRYRVVFGIVMLASFPRFSWVSELTPAYYNPPPGPFQWLPGFAPFWFLTGVELLLAGCFAAMIFGVWVRAASISATVLMLIGFGSVYSTGKVSHSILFVLLPLVMSFVPWGARTGSPGDHVADPPVRQWPLRYLALLIGLAYLTAGTQKLLSGWLNPASQASQGHFFRQILANGRDQWMAQFFTTFDVPIFWETLDWTTILFECGIVFAILTWRSFRILLAVAALFHVSVMLMMNITFIGNVIVYAAFIPWSRLPLPAWMSRIRLGWWAPVLVVIVAVAGWLLSRTGFDLYFDQTFIFVGAAVAVVYLASQALQLLALLRDRRSASAGKPGLS